MPNHIGNSIIVTGPDEEIVRLLVQCFRLDAPSDGQDGERELTFDFGAVIPIDPATIHSVGELDHDAVNRQHWGTKWDAYDCAIIARHSGYLSFEFITANNVPEPIYRELGRQFLRLEFDIAVIDPGSWWAVTGRIIGENASFDEEADCKEVFERVYKEPFEAALQADT